MLSEPTEKKTAMRRDSEKAMAAASFVLTLVAQFFNPISSFDSNFNSNFNSNFTSNFNSSSNSNLSWVLMHSWPTSGR